MSKFKKEVKQAFDDLQDTLDQDFKNVKVDVDALHNRIDEWARHHQNLSVEVRELVKEIATNGVIRDIRKLQKDVEALSRENERHHAVFKEFQYNLEHNGMATAVNKLNKEVFAQRKEVQEDGWNVSRLVLAMAGQEVEQRQEATLAGKVDAIINHLGLDLTVQPEKKTPAKVVAKKKPVAKKGRK